MSAPSHAVASDADRQIMNISGSERYSTRSRSSLPMLYTRSTHPSDYNTQYEPPLMDAYTYTSSSIPRHDSLGSANGSQNYRSWSSTNGSMSGPSTTAYYEPYSPFPAGPMQVPSIPAQQQTGRLPSVTADSFSSFNMGPLNSSLPPHTMQERRLPIPPPPTPQTPYTTADLPEIRPLTSYTEPRVHVNGTHSRNAIPWSFDTASSTYRSNSLASFAPPNGLPNLASQCTTAISQPVLGYQFGLSGPASVSSSPEISPTSVAAPSEGYARTADSSPSSMHPPPTMRYPAATTSQNMPVITSDGHQSTYRAPATEASLYSFSSDASADSQSSTIDGESSGVYYPSRYPSPYRHARMYADNDPAAISNSAYYNDSASYQLPVSHLRSSVDNDSTSYASSSSSTATIRQPQPHSASSIDALCRQSSFDQSQRPSTSSRMSISNFNSQY